MKTATGPVNVWAFTPSSAYNSDEFKVSSLGSNLLVVFNEMQFSL